MPTLLQQQRAKAQRLGKPLVVELWAPSCAPCTRMERTVFPDPRVKAALARVYLARIDGSQGPGEAVHDFVGARGWPTFVRFDAAGRVEHTLYGFIPAPRFAVWLEAIAAGTPYLEAAQAEARRAPRDPSARLLVARLLRDEGRVKEALKAYRAAVRLDPKDRLGVGAVAELERLLIGLSQKQKPERLRAINGWLARFPTARSARSVVGALYSFTGPPQVELEPVLRGVLSRVRTHGDALEPFVWAALRAGSYRVAVEGARQLCRLFPENLRSRTLLAEALHLSGDSTQALKTLDEALATMPASRRRDLAETRARFQRGRGELPLRLEHNATWLWREPPMAGLPTYERIATDRRRARRAARRRVVQEAKARCHAHAQGLPEPEVFLRLRLEGRKITKVTLLEPGAHPRLRACLSRELVGQRLPPVGAPRPREVIQLTFEKKPPRHPR